jgi:hypothetical protein
VIQQCLQILQVQHQHQDVLSRHYLLLSVVLVERAHIIVQKADVNLLVHFNFIIDHMFQKNERKKDERKPLMIPKIPAPKTTSDYSTPEVKHLQQQLAE